MRFDTDTHPHPSHHEIHQMRRMKRMRRGMRGGNPFEQGGRMRRGQIRTALLGELAEGPGHGYELMQRLEERSGGAWRPSPGSVYPTLQMLEDEGLVRSVERDDKKVYEITETGKAEYERRSEEAGGDPWGDERGERAKSPRGQLRENGMQIAMASRQLMHHGTDEQVAEAVEVLRNARRALYGILAGD